MKNPAFSNRNVGIRPAIARAHRSDPPRTPFIAVWRHVLEDGDVVDRLLIAGRQLLTVSSGGKYLRSWSMRDGSLLWELVTYTAAAPSADAKAERDKNRGVDVLPLGADVDGDGDEDLLTLSRGDVALRSLAEGVAAWSAEAAAAFDETVRLHRVARVPSTGKFIAFGVTEDDGAPAAIEMDPKTGEVTRKAIATGAVGLSDCPRGTTLAVGADGNVFASGVTADGAKTYAVDVAKLLSGKTRGAVSFAPVAEEIGPVVRARPVRGADAASDAAAAGSGACVLVGSVSCALARASTRDGKLEYVRTWPLAPGGRECSAAVSSAFTSPDAVVGVGAVTTDADAGVAVVEILTLDPTGAVEAVRVGKPVEGFAPSDRGVAARAWINAYSVKRDGADVVAYRPLVVSADARLSLLGEGGKMLWSREESLALADEVMFARLPPPKTAAAAKADDLRVRPSFGESLRTQVLAVKARIKRATADEMAELTGLRRGRGAKLLPTRDANGFRRQIIALSPAGALTSLHNGDGRVLWRNFLGGGVDAKGEPASAYTYAAVYRWRPSGTDDSRDGEHALVMGTATDADASGGTKTRAVVVDLYTGEIESDVVLPFKAAHVLPLRTPGDGRHDGTNGEHASSSASAALLVDAAGWTAHAFPATSEARDAAYADRARISYYTVDQERNELRGYGLLPASVDRATGEAPASYRVAQTWSQRFPPEVGQIVGYAAKPANEIVHSWTRVLGDRSTLFKYLSPNVVFVATAPKDAPAGLSSVTAHLIDAATGRVLYRVRHADARGPVHAVVCENWVAYHYFNTKAGRYAMSVLEMFDDAEHRKGAAVGELMWSSLVGDNETETVSSLAPPPLRIMGQSYYVRPAATMMATTYSAQGVTGHQVLMGTATDQVVALDKRWLDPRRPTKPTKDDQEEGLIPYTEVLPVFPQSWVTTRHQVAKLQGIVTSPASLESTVLFVAHGLDFFFTRLHPSRSYDMLDEEFSYLLLVVTMVALAAGAFVTQGLAYKKDMEKRWR